MAGNTVQINVGARDEGATANLDALKARLDELGRKRETATVNLGGVAQADVDAAKLQVRLDRLNKAVSNPRIKVDGIDRAIAEMLALQLEMDKLDKKSSESGGFMSKLGGAFSSLGSKMGGVLGNLPLIGGMFDSLGSAGAASAPLILGVVAALVALGVALGPLIAGLGAVSVGIAAFAAGAVGEIKKVVTAHQQLAAAQQALDNAKTPAARLAALQKEKEAVDGLSASEKGLLGDLNRLSGDFSQLQAAVRPEVVKAFGTALDIIHKAMPAITTVAVAAGRALDGFLTNIDKWLSSPSGKKFLAWLQNDGPKAIDTFGKAMFDLVSIIGQVLYWWDRLGNMVVRSMYLQAEAVTVGIRLMLDGFKFLADAALVQMQLIINGAARAFGWIPGIGGKLKTAAAAFDSWKASIDSTFNSAIAKVAGWQQQVANMPKIIKVQGDIADLSNKLAIAKADLAATTNPVRRAKIQADISQLQAQIARANALLNALNGKTATTFVRTVNLGTVGSVGGHTVAPGHAAGGIVGAASGGLRSNQTLVGEHGFEILDLPPGTRVHSNPDSQRMLGQAAGGGVARVQLEWAGGQADSEFMRWLQKNVRIRGGDPAMFQKKVAYQ